MARTNVVAISRGGPPKKGRDYTPDDDGSIEETLVNIFGDASAKILEMMEGDDSDSALLLTQKKMLASSISLLPDAEMAVKQSRGGKGIYQFTTLVGSISTQIETIQAGQDSRLVADSICANVVHPTFLSLAQNAVNSLYRFRSELRGFISAEDKKEVGRLIDETARSIASYMEEQNRELQQKIVQRIVDL